MFFNLIEWSTKSYPDLPWRKGRTLYKTLVSEIMLQQTTVSTVIGKFKPFLKKFPNLDILANAAEEDLLDAWSGLGYYRRVRNLQKAAQYIILEFGGKFPQNIVELKRIPGVGEYTANALLAIGMDKRALAIDANIERVLSRFYWIEHDSVAMLKKDIAKKFQGNEILQKVDDYRGLNEALMDLGREVCQKSSARCEKCPLNKSCIAFTKKRVLDFPKKNSAQKKKHTLSLLRVFVHDGSKILGQLKKKGEWLEGQIEPPSFILESSDFNLKQYPLGEFDGEFDHSFKSFVTYYTIENLCIELNTDEFDTNDYFWVQRTDKRLATSFKKLLNLFNYSKLGE